MLTEIIQATETVTRLTGAHDRLCEDLTTLVFMRGTSEQIPAGHFPRAVRTTFVCPFYRIEHTMYGTFEGAWRMDLSVCDRNGTFVFWARKYVERSASGFLSYANVHMHVRGAWEKCARHGARRMLKMFRLNDSRPFPKEEACHEASR